MSAKNAGAFLHSFFSRRAGINPDYFSTNLTLSNKPNTLPMHCCAISCIIDFRKEAGCQAAANTEFRRRLKQIMQAIAKSVLHGNCMNIQTASAPRTSNTHSRCGKAFAKNGNSLRSDSPVFAHSTSFVHEEVLRLVQIV